ncbi:MAG: 50S ribosomal protein L23 [Candidatus Thermoplasmatota archaeon]
MVNPYKTIMHPYISEKTMLILGKENKLEFKVRRNAKKDEIKKAVEKMFEVKVEKVNTYISKKGKHAIVKLKKGYSAEEIGMRIGVF